MDEAHFTIQPYLIRSWFPRGSKPCVRIAHTRERYTVFGALSEDTFTAQLTEEKCNNETYLFFLKSLLRKYGKILLVVDGASYHFEKKNVQKFYREHKEELHVVQLPPYSPELNPIEQVWKKVKNWLAITLWRTKEEFERQLVSTLNNPEFRTQMFGYYLP